MKTKTELDARCGVHQPGDQQHSSRIMTPRKSCKLWSSSRRRFQNAHAKLAYGIYLITTLFAGLTAIEITHIIVLGNFNNETFQLMTPLAPVTVDVFLGAKAQKIGGG